MLRLFFYAKYHVYPCGTNMTQNHPGSLKDPKIFMALFVRKASGLILELLYCPLSFHLSLLIPSSNHAISPL
jgi:hypothetical protein